MIETTLNDLDLTTEVRDALRQFARVLVETPQFIQFQEASRALEQDDAAQRALTAFQAKQQSLQMLQTLNALSKEEQAELETLRQAVITQQTVTEYVNAEAELKILCRTLNDTVSARLGLRFAMRRSGCCG